MTEIPYVTTIVHNKNYMSMCRNTSLGNKKGRSMIWNLFLMVVIIGTVPETGELGSICLKKRNKETKGYKETQQQYRAATGNARNETVATFRKKRNKMQPETWIAGRRGVVPAGKRRSTKNGTGN